MHHILVVLVSAFLLEAIVGYPAWLYARIRHPVVWIGAGITLLEKNFNRLEWPAPLRWLTGLLTMAVLLAITSEITSFIRPRGYFMPLYILLMATLLAGRSLYDHIRDVDTALTNNGLAAGREKVARVVGRDVSALDESGVCRAAIESLAESFSDGVIAPLFCALLFGLPGIACYKVINTADSMIGHKDKRYHAFGWAAAKLDDVANWIPARISGLLIALAALSLNALRTIALYATRHASPNAGWPEAAMAGALNVQLGGTNYYDGVEHASAAIGDGAPLITTSHLKSALRIYLNACGLIGITLLLAMLRT